MLSAMNQQLRQREEREGEKEREVKEEREQKRPPRAQRNAPRRERKYLEDNFRYQPRENWQETVSGRRQSIISNQEPAYSEEGDPIPFFKGQTETQAGVLYILSNGRLAVGQFNGNITITINIIFNIF